MKSIIFIISWNNHIFGGFQSFIEIHSEVKHFPTINEKINEMKFLKVWNWILPEFEHLRYDTDIFPSFKLISENIEKRKYSSIPLDDWKIYHDFSDVL